jgi:hypothetical protein
MEHILKLVAAQSTATIGSMTRAWLWVMAALWPLTSWRTFGWGSLPYRGHLWDSIWVCLPVSVIVSVVVMAALAIIHIARKW